MAFWRSLTCKIWSTCVYHSLNEIDLIYTEDNFLFISASKVAFLSKEFQNINVMLIFIISDFTSLLIKYFHSKRQITGCDYVFWIHFPILCMLVIFWQVVSIDGRIKSINRLNIKWFHFDQILFIFLVFFSEH